LPVESLTIQLISPALNYFLLSYYCCTGGTLWHLQKFSQYTLVEFTPPSFSLIPLLPIPGIVSTGLIFPFLYMST
jgi:hypothetical protein